MCITCLLHELFILFSVYCYVLFLLGFYMNSFTVNLLSPCGFNMIGLENPIYSHSQSACPICTGK